MAHKKAFKTLHIAREHMTNQISYISLIDKIIEKASINLLDKNNQEIKIHHSFFGIENKEMVWLEVFGFFNKLKKYGCFDNIENIKESYIFNNIDIDILNEYKKNLIEIKEKGENADYLKLKLKDKDIKFEDDKARLLIEGRIVELPPYKNEHYFCRAVFEYNANEPIDWSIIYEKVTGYYENFFGKPSPSKRNWRIIYDVLTNLNKRIKETINTNDDLFVWQEKTVKRQY